MKTLNLKIQAALQHYYLVARLMNKAESDTKSKPIDHKT